MDYEQMYTNALERAKDGKPIDEIFPELNESEDEKIKGAIIDHLKDCNLMEWATWLEKHKSVVVPKFRVGDTIRIKNSNAEYLITDISDGNYCGKGWCLDIVTCDESDDYELVEPKLADWSEDEKIRKAISSLILSTPNIYKKIGFSHSDCVAWLEKQGKLKPVDKADSKHKVGDWVVNNHGEPQFSQVIARSWPDSKIKRAKNNLEIFINTATLDKQYHLWTIQDAKPGDVLANKYGSVFIYAGFEEGRATVDCYCYVSAKGDEFFVEDHKTGSWYYISDLMPAIKEQCELLFQRMHEAGYEWDAKKLELRKIEQRPLDNVKPKFKVGDWIISDEAHKDYRICKIIEVENENYKIESIYGYSGYNQYNVFDSIYRLWTIEDVKPGDILAVEPYFDTDKYPFPFVAIYESRGLDFFNSYCFNSFDGIFYNQGIGHDLNKIHPATKEQREFLFDQMKDAGYEWDVEKKELRKIEQNFSEHEKSLLERFKKAVYDCAWEKVTCKVEGESKEEYADRWAEQLLMLVRDWADDYIDSREDSIRRRSFDKGKYSMQNHAWSEEDEKIYNRIYDLIHTAAYTNYDVDEDGKELGEYARITNWFKSIKERKNERIIDLQ